MLQRRSMEYIINSAQRVMDAVVIPYVADVELQLIAIQSDAHVLLFLLIAAEDANFRNIGMQEALKNCITERARTTSNQQCFVLEHK